VKQMKKTKQKT